MTHLAGIRKLHDRRRTRATTQREDSGQRPGEPELLKIGAPQTVALESRERSVARAFARHSRRAWQAIGRCR